LLKFLKMKVEKNPKAAIYPITTENWSALSVIESDLNLIL